MEHKRAITAGKLANGWERGKGSVVHLVPSEAAYYGGAAICGERPAIAWAEREDLGVTCPKCLKAMKEMAK